MSGAERHLEGDRDWPLSISEGFEDWRPGHSADHRVGGMIALQYRAIALVEQPIIGAIAARLVGTMDSASESEPIEKTRRPETTRRLLVGTPTERTG